MFAERILWVVMTAVVAFASLGAASASAATGNEGSGTIIYAASAGETNTINVTQSGTNLQITEATLNPGAVAPCTASGHVVTCPDSSTTALSLQLGDQNDTVTIDPAVLGHLLSINGQGGLGGDLLLNSSAVPGTLDDSDASGGVTIDLASGSSAGAVGADNFAGFENVNGSSSADTIAGDSNANVISGGAGADTIAGAGGDDTLNGGSGQNTVTYSPVGVTSYGGAPSGVDVNLAAGTATGDGTDTLTGFQTAIGSPLDDTMTPSGGGSTLHGGSGNDTLLSGPGDDTFDGGGGVDTLDFSNNGVGVIANLATGFAAGAGSDTIVLDSVERVLGSAFDDQLTGDQNANFLVGQGGNDTLAGGGGNDALQGGAGRDSADFSSSLASVTANLAAGTATGQGSDVLDGIENLTGSGLGDTLTGDSGDNLIQGAGGDDTIAGRGGDDILNGGAGSADTASFSGSSAPVFADLAAGTATGEGADTLSGFENLTGSNYADTLKLRDNLAGSVHCGAGVDSAVVDLSDVVNVDCESVDNGESLPPPPPPPTVTVTVTQPAPPPVTVTVTAPSPPTPPKPTTTIKTKPKATVKTHGQTAKVSFTFTASINGSTFKCRLDAGAFTTCTSPRSYTAKLGKHTLSVEAMAAGQTGPAATARFTVAKS